MVGTLLNAATVLVGGLVGTALGGRLPERVRETVLHGLGVVTLIVGIQLALQTRNILIVMGSILVGALLGEWWRIEDRLQGVGKWLEARVALRRRPMAGEGTPTPPAAATNEPSARRTKDQGLGSDPASRFVQGYVTASLVFCVGPMTILGSIQDGLTGDYRLLAIKSLLDGFAALAFASSLGIGVVFSVLTILLYQGGVTLLAGLAQNLLSQPMIAEMTATGGVLIMGIGLLLLDLKRIRVGNFLPALIIAPLVVAVLQRFGLFGIGN
ncbi:MAG: DUF554 domain-containing protein [Anaerolineae bacterium]